MSNRLNIKNYPFPRKSASVLEIPNSDSDDEVLESKMLSNRFVSDSNDETDSPPKNEKASEGLGLKKLPSAGPSNRNRINSPKPKPESLTESDSDDSDEIEGSKKNDISPPGEYDPSQYNDLDVGDDIKEQFQFITKYVPQNLSLDCKFKPFIPDYIPAVGDIDAFLKVVPPSVTVSGEPYGSQDSELGLVVLDEPAANQSDPALLHLQLRASSVSIGRDHTQTMVVKKVENVEKESKTIDKWIRDVSGLHKSKPSSFMKYSEPMPELEDLMQEWPEKFEAALKTQGFPSPKCRLTLTQYIDLICTIFDIPICNNRIESLHMFFSLYAAIKHSQQIYNSEQLYRENSAEVESNNVPDQLVLE